MTPPRPTGPESLLLIPWAVVGFTAWTLLVAELASGQSLSELVLGEAPPKLHVFDRQIQEIRERCEGRDLVLLIGDSRSHTAFSLPTRPAEEAFCRSRGLSECPCIAKLVAPLLTTRHFAGQVEDVARLAPIALFLQSDVPFPNPRAHDVNFDVDKRIRHAVREGPQRTPGDGMRVRKRWANSIFRLSSEDIEATRLLLAAMGDTPVFMYDLPRSDWVLSTAKKIYWKQRDRQMSAFSETEDIRFVDLGDNPHLNANFYDWDHLNDLGITVFHKSEPYRKILEAAVP